MNKLLQHILKLEGYADNQSVPKAQKGKQVKSKLGENVIVDGKKMNTYSDEYENAYKKGIGQWVSYNKASGEWDKLPSNLPNSAYKNAEFISGVNDLPEVTVSAKMNPNVVAARNKAKQQAGSYEDYVKREQSTVPRWAGAMGFDNKEADKQIYDRDYNNILNTRSYQNLVDAIPQGENESRIDYMNRFDQVAGKNSVARARTANVTEPFEPGNLNKLGQWAWKGVNHIGAGTEALFTSNPSNFISAIQKGIDRGNQPVSGMTADEAKEVGIMQPFETADDLAYRYGFRPALMAGDNFVNSAGKQTRDFNSRNLGASDTDKMFTSILNPINYITGSELLSGGKNIAKATRIGEGLETAGKFLTEQTPLRNAYKVNPFAFKPNSDAAYRMIGNEGYADALTSGVIRPPKGSGHTEAYYNKGYPLDTKLRDATGRAGYEGPYMAEVKGNKDLFVDDNVASYTGPMFDDPVLYSKQNIPIDNQGVKFYKENWLQGYKEVPRQRVPNRSSLKSYNPNRQDPVTQTVYNPETGTSVNYDVDGNVIGNSKKLTTNEVKTFNQGIENRPITTGSTPPPPEGMAPYLVTDTDAMMSKNAQWLESPQYLKRRMASTGETAVQVKADVAKILAEGEKTKFEVKPYGNTNTEGYYTRPKKYDWFERKVLGKKDIPAEVSVKQGLPFERHMSALDHETKHSMSQFATTNNYKNYPTLKVGNWFERNIKGLGTHADYLNKAPEQQVRYLKILEDIEKSKGIPKGDIITPEQFDDWVDTRYNPYYSKGSDDDVVDLVDNIAKRYGKNTRKVLLDKLNKAYVIPGAVGATGVLGAAQQKANGGMIVDPMGQWAHPGKNTRIPGSSITMKGVNYPVMGIGNNGMTQVMKPGGEYDFRDADYVDEYPIKGPNLKDIMAMKPKPKKRYEPSKGVKNLKAILSGIDLSTLPAIETPIGFIANRTAGLVNAVGDAYTSARYAMDGQWKNAGIDAGEAVLDLIPFAKGKRTFNLAKGSNLPSIYNKLSAGDKAINTGLKVAKAAAYADDFQDALYTPPKKEGGGYVVTRSSDSKGKTHKVTGPDGTVKYFGDSKLGQHPKDEKRKKAFYARHKSNLAGNPYFRAFARKTWEDGGQTDDDREMLSGVADILRRINDTSNRKEVANYMMDNFRDEDVSFEPNKFLKSANVFGKGGEMIRRADGSYSKRGLWDNIRANKGSGKKPTKQMLEQERKIRSKQEGGEDVAMPQTLEELLNPTRRGSASFGFGFNNEKFGTNYGYSGSDNLKNGTHSLNVSLPAFMKTGSLDISGAYSPGKSYGANLTGMAPANFIKKGAMMNFSGGYEKDVSPGMRNVAPSYNMAAGFKIPTKVGNFTVNASYRK